MNQERARKQLESYRVITDGHWVARTTIKSMYVNGVSWSLKKLAAMAYLGLPLSRATSVLSACDKQGCWNPSHLTIKRSATSALTKLAAVAVLALAIQLPAAATYLPAPTKNSEVKATFKDNHPKVYKTVRKTRAACAFVAPIIQVGGSVAQVFVPFLIR